MQVHPKETVSWSTMRQLAKMILLLLGSSVHGSQYSSPDRIVGGALIDISKVPYMLSMMVNKNHVCGATIIAEEWGLTAAHCVISFIDRPEYNVTVRSGSSQHDFGGTIHNVTFMIYHEKYDPYSNDYDVALIKVEPPFNYSSVTAPAMLPTDVTKSIDATRGLVTGWGYFEDDDPVLSEDLQYVIVPKVPTETCRMYYSNRFTVTKHQICYGFEEGGKDACKGDSGGPLVYDGTVVGITSWGDDCGEPYSPGVYTDVWTVMDWIENKMML
ncbi:trypsin-7 [Augochlora pura]